VRTLNLVGLRRAGLADSGPAFKALKQAHRLLFRSELSLADALEQIQPLLEHEAVAHLYHFAKESSQGDRRRGLVPGR
jgi:UDP-N-acetylglucosamine acyltransferase